MKQLVIYSLFIFFSITAFAQEDTTDHRFNGYTKAVSWDRMIPPHGIQVTFEKTSHIIFPAKVRYIDLGSSNLIAAKASPSENVVKVKAAVRGFKNETNFSVITDEGNFYTFNVMYAEEPDKLNIEAKDFIHDGLAVNRPNNSMDIYLEELRSESPKVVQLIMKSIYKSDRRKVKHIGCKRFGIQYTLKGIYAHNDLLYFHTQTKNTSNVLFQVDYITLKIVDKKIAKRTAIQEQIIVPVRAFNYVTEVNGRKTERTVMAVDRFTIPDDKKLVFVMTEKNGGRHQTFAVDNADIIRAQVIDDLIAE